MRGAGLGKLEGVTLATLAPAKIARLIDEEGQRRGLTERVLDLLRSGGAPDSRLPGPPGPRWDRDPPAPGTDPAGGADEPLEPPDVSEEDVS